MEQPTRPLGKRKDRQRVPEPPIVDQNGHAKEWVTKVRPSLGILPTVIGIDLLNGIRAGIFLAAYVILEWVSFIHEYKGLAITPWNPVLGVVFALMVFAGSRYGIVLFAGVVLAEILVLKSKLEWWIILSIAAIIAAGYGVVALVLRKHFQIDIGLNHLSDVFVLLLAGISGAILVALILSMLLLTDAEIDFGDVIVTFVPLLVGDAIGIAVMTPLTLRLILNPRRSPIRFSRTLVPEILFYVLLITVTLWIIVGTESANGFKFFYLLFVPVVVAAVRHGLDGACMSLGLSQIALVGLLHIHSYDAQAFTEFRPPRPRSRNAPQAERIGSGAGITLQSRERDGVGADPRDQPTDDGCSRSRTIRAAPSARAGRRSRQGRQQSDDHDCTN